MIVQMKRLTLVAHKADEAQILKNLQRIDAVEIIQSGDVAEATTLESCQARVQQISDALAIASPFASKAGLLTPRPDATVSHIQAQMQAALQCSDTLAEISRMLTRNRAEIDKNNGVIEQLRPWESFPDEMQFLQNAKSVKYFVGILAAADVEKLHDIDAYTEYQFFCDGAQRSTVVACAPEDAKSIAGFLKSLNWSDVSFPKLAGKPADAIKRLEKENRELVSENGHLEAQLAAQAKNSDLLAAALDAAVIERDRAAAATEIAKSDATFQLEGWVRADEAELLKLTVEKVTDAFYLDVREPGEDEAPPSVVQNKAFARPFEEVTNLYSRPDPKGIDATPYMAPFYVLLFGLMLSDTGYGVVLSIGCWLYLKFKKPTGISGGFAKVLFWGGLSTIVWGVLVGTFFGMDFDTLFGTNNIFPLLVDPMGDPIMMLILCFGLGVLHILFGVALKMKMSFERHDWQTAIFDNFSWMLIILGLIMLALEQTKMIGTIMAIVGALMILLFKGRAKKNVFSRTASGLGELYQVTSFLSDILSYARLFALGIATGVIASVFNDLCAMLTGSPNIFLRILGIAVACALLVALHAFNIAINTLGAFVHCARLQYVEFYGKFYEAGGREFRPLGYRTKNVHITGE